MPPSRGGGPPKTFGLTSNRGRGTFNKRGGGAGRNYRDKASMSAMASLTTAADQSTINEDRFAETAMRDEIDSRLGFERLESGSTKQAWLVNMHPTLIPDPDGISPSGKSAVDFYFIQDDSSSFKVTLQFQPYFLIGCRPSTESTVEEWLKRKYESKISKIERQRKEDLKLPNHLMGHSRILLKLSFHNVHDLLDVRREILPMAQKSIKKRDAIDTYADVLSASSNLEGMETSLAGGGDAAMDIGFEDDLMNPDWMRDQDGDGWSGNMGKGKKRKGAGGNANGNGNHQNLDPEECIVDIREYDVPYYLRAAIDKHIRVGLWYDVIFSEGTISLRSVPERVKRAEPVVLAFDIETTKQPLKFPDAQTDCVMMISYMVDGQGFLITNREIVSEDIDDFEYTPKDEYEGPFIIFNEPDELSLLHRFFSHFREVRPTVVATYNGDSFDFPFLDARATLHGLNMGYEIGFSKDAEEEYKSQAAAHMDCFRWVKRDSYLPQGSQGLKAVTVAKLGYDPMELDPEVMTPYAIEQPQTLAQYSVSDAVATYYLYMKYVHPFIFSLCNIIPLNPDEVLRKGSGTLCETLLMVEAYKGNIVMPNRHVDPDEQMFDGHLLQSETYVGGHVEALEAGVFRSDIATNFKIDPTAAQELIDQLDDALKFSITVEGKMDLDDITNYDEVKDEIQSMLEVIRDAPNRTDKPLIYHLDVAAMYPNIMLSNRLQPDSVVDEATCATCDYNRPGMKCDKKMEWAWRGEFFPAKKDELNMIRHALASESLPPKWPGGDRRSFDDLSQAEKTALLHKRLGDYSRKVYRKTHETRTVVKEATICQRENPFYIDTVRDFRDRRYEYKGLHKTWKKNLDVANSNSESTLGEIAEAKKMIVLYDSLQLAHKCILNSFYGYVMRKGARWYSMEMAGITCLTGSSIIQMARVLVERIGRPLELDTDGIWCMLPGAFPENFNFKTSNGKKFGISYPCTMLNHLVHEKYTNHQYHTLEDPKTGKYKIHSENSIFFELDGPYRAMILPASKEEDRLLKKRYAVFEEDGSLAELKGFEVKRRGELQLIKDFQKQIFEKFLLGDDLIQCYAAVAKVADQWLDVLYSRGATLHDAELIDLIAENKSMSRTLLEYGSQKSAAITTAKRLAEFLGAQMVKDKGLACKFIISAKPHGAPVTERAVPVAIFGAEADIRDHYLRRFLKDPGLTDFDLRSILDWEYYIERFGGVIQKLITIPAAMQKVPNPVPRVRHPDWLFKRIAKKEDKFKQRKLTDAFQPGQRFGPMKSKSTLADAPIDEDDFEEIGSENVKAGKGKKNKEPRPEVPLPDVTDDYRGWVSVMRKRWSKRRQERKKELKSLGLTSKTAAAAARSAPALGAGRMAELLSRRSAGMATSNWDVIQICPSSRPGEYRLWVLVENQLQSLKLKIPRQFYINFKSYPTSNTFIEGYTAEQQVRTLPRGAQCRYLFLITVAEDIYLEEEAHFSQLVNHPNVEGVYEMQVPLDIRALVKLGSTCSLIGGTVPKLSKGLDSGFELSDLQKPSSGSWGLNKEPYLKNGISIRYFYLYHASRDGRHIFGLFSPDGEAKVHVVDSAGLRQLPNLETMYSDRAEKMKTVGKVVDEEGVFTYPDSIKFELQVHRNEGRALKALAKDLNTMRTARQGASILCLSSSQPQAYYEEKIGSALTDFPILSISASVKDDALPALGWQIYGARRMCNGYLRISEFVSNWIKLASTLDVPVCNIENDFSSFGADIDFARRLAKNDMVLWWSQTPQPDLGGREEDTNGTSGAWGDEIDNDGGLELSNPGCYSNVTFEVTLKDLAINSVMQSGTVNDIEGSGGGSMAFDSASRNLDEYAKGTANTDAVLGDSVLTSQVFLAVKSMVRSWYLSKAKGRTIHSPLLADHFWRWVSNPTSAMYEPALHRFLNGLMRKTLLQLLAEFKRLGANIVYASYSRIFLLTSKPTAGSAAAYGRYLMSAVTSRDLFKHVNLEIEHCWEYLLWMDIANFGGVLSTDPEGSQLREAAGEEEDIDANNKTEMNWNIASFLPPAVEDIFFKVVAHFIHRLYESKRKTSAALERTPMRIIHRNLNQAGEEEESTGQDVGEVEETLKEKETKYAQTLVRHQLTRKILKAVSEINSVSSQVASDPDADESLIEAWSFPIRPGAYLQAKGPALEFIKTICAVLGLARELSSEVGVCRRNALELIGIREFSPEAEWRNPCAPFRVSRVICNFCQDERTLDLSRDSDLMPSIPGQALEWKCSKCQYPYDRTGIESKLVTRAHSLLSAYSQQDLRCNRCGGVRPNNVAAHCDCSGSWGTTITRRETLRRLRLMQTVAKYHAMELLECAVDGLIELI